MAVTHQEVQVTWPTAQNSTSISTSSNATSEVVSINTAAIEAMICLKADNDGGTPASGDYVDFYILYTSGDPDGTGTDEYDTPEHAIHLGRVRTYPTGDPGEDPAIIHVPISVAAKSFKLYAKNLSTTNAQTVSACMTEVRG